MAASKTKQFCETSFHNGKLSAELTASCQCVLRCFHSMCLKYCAYHEKLRPSHTRCCTCHTKSSSQNWRSDAPNATPLRKSAPGPPNISDEHVSCTAHATENASLQILFACPTPANACEAATKPSCLAHFWQGTESLPPETTSAHPKVVWGRQFFTLLTWKCALRHTGVHFFDITTSKSAPTLVFFVHFDLEMCFAPHRRALFRHHNLEKCSYPWCSLYILTWKCASRHKGVHFFGITTSKSGPNMVCFVHFDSEMCFAPQRRALFRHHNFQKWSEHGVLCTFWLGNLLRGTFACTFLTTQRCALYILTCKCVSRHNGVQLFISHLARWLRTRRFSKPTFRPSGATNHWKKTMFGDFPAFSRTCIFFLLTLSLLLSSLFCSSPLWLFPPLLSLLSDSSRLCFFICPYCRKFDF